MGRLEPIPAFGFNADERQFLAQKPPFAIRMVRHC
jgi:hypothetical protein